MQTYQYIRKYLQQKVNTYVWQHRGERFVVRIGMGLVAALALFVMLFGVGVRGAYAHPTSSQSSARVAFTASVSTAENGSVVAMIEQVFGSYAGTAVSIASCESGLNPAATNPYSGAAGVFQIMPGTWSGTSWAGYSAYNAWANINAAHEIFVRDGYNWHEWVC